jgi:hypothetical protein
VCKKCLFWKMKCMLEQAFFSPKMATVIEILKKRLCHFFIEVTPMEGGSSSIPRWAGTYFQSFPLLWHYPILNSTLKRNNCRVRPSSGAGPKIRGLGQGSSPAKSLQAPPLCERTPYLGYSHHKAWGEHCNEPEKYCKDTQITGCKM